MRSERWCQNRRLLMRTLLTSTALALALLLADGTWVHAQQSDGGAAGDATQGDDDTQGGGTQGGTDDQAGTTGEMTTTPADKTDDARGTREELVGGTGAAELTQVWEATGLKGPESAVYDPARNVIYVSNVNGEPAAKDGTGFVAKLAPDGTVTELEWVEGLDAPKGMALVGDTLYVADNDVLVAIDVASGQIEQRHAAAGAKFLNDVTADQQGRVYVSDMMTNSIWRLEGGQFSEWLRDEALENPNGLLAEDGRLLVGSWGRMAEDFSTKVPGHMKVVDVATKRISPLGDTTPVGNLDGVEPDGRGGYTATDWLNGAIFHVAADGKATRLLDLNQGSADHEFIEQDRLVVLPMMTDNKVVAYRLD
jgi:sugar lactone lactonase YvrE